jgi:mannose-6-phosphate isomerase-like protein (cupin superfamily)
MRTHLGDHNRKAASMADYTAKQIGDMEAAFGGGLVKARAELGVTSFGVQIVQMPGDYKDYPEHDHAGDGQEEVYMALSGSGYIDIDGERVDLTPDTLVRVGPAVKRKIYPGPDGLRLIALGGVPGQAYEVASFTELEAA